MSLSSTEAEYVALIGAVQEALWLRRVLEKLKLPGRLTKIPVRKLPTGGSKHHEEVATEATKEVAEHSRQ